MTDDSDKQPEWDRFLWRYVPTDHFCVVCASKAAVQAWAMGEHDVRPPDGLLRREIVAGMSAEEKERVRERLQLRQSGELRERHHRPT